MAGFEKPSALERRDGGACQRGADGCLEPTYLDTVSWHSARRTALAGDALGRCLCRRRGCAPDVGRNISMYAASSLRTHASKRYLARAPTSRVSLTPTEARGNSKSVRTAGAAHAAMAALSLHPPPPPLCASCCASCGRARWRELVVGVFLLVRALLGGGGGGGEPRLLRRRPCNWAVSIPVMGVSARVLSCWRTGAGQDASGACRRIRDELVSGVAGGGHVGTVCRSIEDHRSEVVEGECSCVCVRGIDGVYGWWKIELRCPPFICWSVAGTYGESIVADT